MSIHVDDDFVVSVDLYVVGSNDDDVDFEADGGGVIIHEVDASMNPRFSAKVAIPFDGSKMFCRPFQNHEAATILVQSRACP